MICFMLNKNNLKISIIQSELHWEDAQENLTMFSKKIENLTGQTDLVVLPEMFNTGFSMESKKLAETMDGLSVNWMKEQAKKIDAAIIGSLIIQEDGDYFNRLVWMSPDGNIHTYDKRHLFRMAGEHNHFTAGRKRLIVEYKGWRICPLVCYDLRFPVWSRNSSITNHHSTKSEYDILIYVANWPAIRKAPWSKLLEARAIENQAFVIGVNRVGEDENGNDYSGDSVAINPKGECLSSIKPSTNQFQTMEFSLKELNDFREKFPVEMDADEFKIIS